MQVWLEIWCTSVSWRHLCALTLQRSSPDGGERILTSRVD